MTVPHAILTFDDMCDVLRAYDVSHGDWERGMYCHRRILHVLVEATGTPRDEAWQCTDFGALLIELAVRMHNQHVYDDFDFDDFYRESFLDTSIDDLAAYTAPLTESESASFMSAAVRPLNKVVLECENGVTSAFHRATLYRVWTTLLRYGILLVARGINQVPTHGQVFAAFRTRLPKT